MQLYSAKMQKEITFSRWEIPTIGLWLSVSIYSLQETLLVTTGIPHLYHRPVAEID